MLQNPTQLRLHLERFVYVKIDALLLSTAAKTKVDILVEKLVELSNVAKKLQCFDASIRNAENYFSSVLENFPDLS